ncbi:hypothetical protein HAX54_025201 [Datura stramonium]|uniref:Uncharacterized protein n=1 Tax=Datura stramonium TaxID=4076 RepID=A0ABS8S6W5_DATST|nr:hypothetical protein [Datura stramonium]
MASSSSSSTVLHGKEEEKGFPSLLPKLFQVMVLPWKNRRRKFKILTLQALRLPVRNKSSGLRKKLMKPGEEDEEISLLVDSTLNGWSVLKDDEEERCFCDNGVDEDSPSSTPNAVLTSNTYGLAGNWYNSREICYYNQESLGTYVKPVADSVNHQVKSSNTVFYSSDDLKRPIQCSPILLQQGKWKSWKFNGSNTSKITTSPATTLQPHGCFVSIKHVLLSFPKMMENEREDLVSKENQHSQDQTSHVVNDQEMQLPQEWTY